MNVRTNKLLLLFSCVALLLIGKIFYIQVIDKRYKKYSENNSLVYKTIYPPRGIIYDRNGEILVGNSVRYDIMVTPHDLKPFDTTALAAALDIDIDYVRERLSFYEKTVKKSDFRSYSFLKMVPSSSYVKFAEQDYLFPAFSAVKRSIREYPFNAGGNLLGYLTEVNATDLSKYPDYKSGDYIGRTGIEAAREQELKGEKGYHIFLRNVRNQLQSSYENGIYDLDAVPGSDIISTIDAHLQQYGQRLMEGKTGSVVAIEPSSGEILAMVSSPGIDVDILANIGKYYGELSSDPKKPLFNRTVMASYPPGSVFKLINGLIGMQEGVLKPEYSYPCYSGYYYTKSSKLGCHAHSSPLKLKDAIATSCNGYFCYVLKNVLENKQYSNISEAFDKWREYVLSFGFGRKLESDFPSELGGNIPTSDYYNKIYGKNRWRFPTIVSLSIGQGEIGATPLQIANLAAIMANRGYYYIPHLIKDSENVQIDQRFKEKQYTMVDSEFFDIAVEGMLMAVNGGGTAGATALRAAIPGLEVCGKTGTAQNPHGKDNSVFICFAPKDNPKIAVAAYVENAGFGATWALPVASLMLEMYLNGEICPQRKAMEDTMLNTRFF